MVSSPSAASLQSESVAPFTRTDDIPAASVTFNTSSNFMSIGPVSPTEDSSEDHAEIDRTSTELSPDSVRFEQDILDTKTEDEAPDLDDDYLPASPVLGQELSDRIFSAEVTEDTDITTPMEMRDSHTERDATASNLGSVEDKEGTDGKVDIIKECLPSDLMGDDSFTYLCQETAEIHSRVVKLQELVDHHKVDLQTARSEAETIQNTIDDIQEAVKNSTYENNEEFYNKTKDIVATISSVSDNLSKIMLKLHSPDQGCSEIGSHAEVKCSSGETEIDMVNAESPKDGSPSDSNLRDQSLSDLLDSDDINRDSLEEEFDRLAAHLTLSPSADDIGGVSQKVTQIASPDGPLFPVSSSVVYPSKPPDALQATQREPAEGSEHFQQDVFLVPSEEKAKISSHDETVDLDKELEIDDLLQLDAKVDSSVNNSQTQPQTDNKIEELHTAVPLKGDCIIHPKDKENAADCVESHSDFEGVVVRRGTSRTGPRPTTFPLCLLQPDVVSCSPEAQEYFRQQQEVLEEMGRQGQLQMDVTDLRDLTSPESLAASNELEESDTDISDHASKLSHRKLIKSSSSYENIYDKADLKAVENQDTPSTQKLTSSLGDPFTTKTSLPPEMCSSFENLYMESKDADPKIIVEADLLATKILEAAVNEAVQEEKIISDTQIPATSTLIDNESKLKATISGCDGSQQSQNVGVVFTERKEYGGGVKPPAETTGGHSHISPSQIPHPSQSSKSQSFTKQKLPSTVSTTEQQHRPLEASTSLPSRPVRRHERTLSQATNIYTGTMPPESKQDQKKEEKEAIAEEVDGINENIKPYSERKQFWESVTSQSFESKGSNILKSETESDTDTTATDGTVIERQALPRKSSTVAESFDSEEDYVAHREDPAFYENKGFVGTEKIDLPKESTREGAVSPFEVFREEDAKEDLQSPEDIAFKDVSSKRALFEKEIKRQSMEIEESQSWKRSSKEYEDTVVISEESASSLLKKKEEKEHKIREMEEEKRKEKTEIKEELKSVTDIKSRVESKMEKSSGVTDYSETSESSRLHEEKMESKDKKIISDITKGDRKTITQTDISKEKKEKESIEKMVHERKDSHSGTFSKTVSTSEEKVESSSEAKEVIHTKSEDQDTSRDEITEEDMTRTEETSDEEPDDVLGTDKVTVNITEETRQLGDTHETIVRETTTTRDGDQEQRVIKETKTQETVMADGSTVKTTSITTFTTQLDAKDSEDESEGLSGIRQEKSFLEKDSTKAKTAKEKSAAFVEQMKSEMFSQELSSSAEDQSPEHKLITPKDVKAPVSLQTQKVVQSLASPILVPEENIQDVVWEASQERSDTFISETVQDIPVQQSYEHHLIKDISQEGPTMSDKSRRKSSGPEKTKLSEEEARKLAIEIVEEVKQEAVKRSPLATPSQAVKDFPSEGGLEGDLEESAAFTKETSNKIEKYIQEQLGDAVDEKQLKLIESVTARKAEILQRKLIGSEYQQSMEITDEDLRSSGAELSPIEHQMERLRQMTEEEDNQRYPREPSEADESESSMIIHDSVDDVSSEYDQANQMITKTLDSLKGTDITKPKSISTIEEIPEEREASQVDGKSLTEISKTEVKETARQLVKEVTEKAQESEALKQASLAAAELTKGASGSLEHSRTPSPKPGSRKGSCMDDEELRREFRRDYEDKKKMFKEEMTSDKQEEVFDEGPSSSEGTRDTRVYHQKSSESHKEVHMESSMTESMEESSTVESFRSFEGKMKSEVTTSVIKEVKEIDSDKKEEKFSGSPEEVVLRKKKTHIDEFNRRSGTDIDAYSSSGESHYFTAGEGTSDSRTGSRPCSSDVEALMSDRTATGTSEYDTAFTSQDTSQYSNYSTTSQEYRTAASSMSSRDSMKSIDSESSGNLASIELSEASETLVPSALELERDMDLLEQELYEEEMMQSAQTHQTIIPQLTIQSDTPKSEDAPGTFDIESDDAEYEPETKDEDYDDSIHTTSKMKRSMEMTFHPEPDPLTDEKKQPVAESVASSLEESTVSELSMTTVVEQETSLQGSTTDSNMTASSVSEQMLSSLEGHELERHISRTDSGVLTTETGDGDRALHSVTITATSVPSSTPDQNTASMCTQVTSETRSEVDLTESEQFFRANGPTEVDYVPEYDDEEVQGARPAVTPIIPSAMEVSGAVAGPSEGPKKVLIPEECYETEADQEYGQMMRESEYSDMAEAELQYSLEEQPEAEMSSMLVIDEPLERPKTPEPGFRPSSRPTQMVVQSPEEAEFTEVDKRFSAVFSTTYEEREEGARSLMPGMSIDIPDITITEHTLPMASQYCYPDLEREEDFPECRALAEADNRVSEIPATPGSQESASTCASRKSSSTDSEQGREYCLDDKIGAPSFGSFEMIEADDIDDISEFERTLFMHEERMMEMSQIKEEDEEYEDDDDKRVSTSPIPIPSQLKAVKLDCSVEQKKESEDNRDSESDPSIEEQRRWLELQFEESSAAQYEYSQGFIEHVYSGPLEDIEEEREDAERRDFSHITKNSSLSSTPEYDVLAGRKFFTRSGEHDDISMCSLQEFENLERAVAVEAVARRSSSGSQDSLNGRRPDSKSGQGDDISVGSFASLQEFERLEKECLVVEAIEQKAQEEEAMLSEIEEGHESQVSESESCETLSEPGRGSVDGEEYDQRMFEIDEIIRQAQTNVEKFDKNKPQYEGVQLRDIVSVDVSGEDGTGSSQADRTPSVGREEGDADSLEEAQLPELDLDQTSITGAGASSAKQDVMNVSTDSIEASTKNKVPRETSQDSLEKIVMKTDAMTASADSIEFAIRQDVMTTSVDSLEGRQKRPDPMSASTDSIEPGRRDVMASSIDSLGRDDSSGRDADISSGSEQMRPNPRDALMECSTDSLEPTSSQATHAYQYDTDSVMSGSFTSGCSNTLVASAEDFPDMMTSSLYLPEGELPPEGEQYVKYMHSSSGTAVQVKKASDEPGYSHTVTRVVSLPPEAHQVSFTGPDAQKKLEEFLREFNAGEHSTQDETVDGEGNVHIRRVTQKRVVADPSQTREHGFSVSDPSVEESEIRDEHGNVTRVVRRTVVTTHTVEVDLDTGEPVQKFCPTTQPSSSPSSSSRIPRPVTSPPLASRLPRPGPPPGSRGPREPVPPSLEPNTVSDVVQPDSGAGARQAPGLDVEEMSNIMESYTSDGSDFFTTTTHTTTSIDPDPITSTQITRITRTEIKDGEIKEEVYEEY